MGNQGHSQSAGEGQLLAHETGKKAAGFKLHSEYQPTGDQPQAIEALVKGFKEGNLNFPHQHGVLNLENSIFQPLKKA